MVRATCLVLILAIVLATASVARAADALTSGDRAWLQSNLNLPANSPVIATLDLAQQTKLHALIGHARGGADRRRQAVVNFLTGTVGDSFAATLQRSLETPPNPVDAMTGR
jgi:hypothetical protein